jgi:hypothetical protein
MKKNNAILLAAILIVISSCKLSYLTNYETYLLDDPEQDLVFSDSIISIRFDTKPNGIIFDIENHTDRNLFLLWDKSYFVDPSGNSSKLLNTDILETTKSITEKENYESIIPKGEHFRRFTCSVKNLSFFQTYNSYSILNEATNTISMNSYYNEFFLGGKYWYLGSKREYGSKSEIPTLDMLECREVKNFIQNNDQLGMGITIKNQDKEIEYHFKFRIKCVIISKKLPSDELFLPNFQLCKDDNFEVKVYEK